MNAMHSIIGELMGGLGAALVAAMGVRQLIVGHPHRRMRRAKLWSIADLPEDVLGRVVGTVRVMGRTLVAPLTGRSCVYYVARVANRQGRTVFEQSEGVVFEIEDATGAAMIDAQRAISDLTATRVEAHVWGPEADARRYAYLAEHHVVDGKVFDEAVVVAGSTIAVFGAGHREDTGKLRMVRGRDVPLILADDPTSTHPELPQARIRTRP